MKFLQSLKLKSGRRVAVVLASLITILSLLNHDVYADSYHYDNEDIYSVASVDFILTDYERVKRNLNYPIEIELSTFSLDEDIRISDNSEEILEIFDRNISDKKQVKKIYDRILDKTVTRIITENSQVDFDANGNLVAYRDLEDYSDIDKNKLDYTEDQILPVVYYEITEQNQLEDTILIIEDKLNLVDYKLSDCSNNIEGTWILTWVKEYNNGLVNPYDCVNVAIDAKDGTISSYIRNVMLPNAIEPIISNELALQYASKIISKYDGNIIGAELTFTRPNFYFEEGGPYEIANFVRLCYRIFTDSGIVVDVDAETGEILGGDLIKAISARSMSVIPEFEGYFDNALGADLAFERLGYSQGYGTVYHRVNQTDMEWILSRSDMYALYLSCHGNLINNGTLGYLGDRGNWELEFTSATNYGIWRFVYLDACLTSKSNLFANAFHCTNAGECFVGWNVSVWDDTSYDFNMRFFPRLGTMTVNKAVVDSLMESRAAGKNQEKALAQDTNGNLIIIDGNICNPGFIGDVNYYGWAW